MKSNTIVWVAIRNIGNSQDAGKSHEAPLSQAILWLATELAQVSMAGRIVIGIGRNQADALKGINVKSAGKALLDDDMKALLDSVFDSSMSFDDAEQVSADLLGSTSERIAGDDYVA